MITRIWIVHQLGTAMVEGRALDLDPCFVDRDEAQSGVWNLETPDSVTLQRRIHNPHSTQQTAVIGPRHCLLLQSPW